MRTSVAVLGATGTMGQLICGIVEGSDEFELVARLSSADGLDGMLAAEIVVDVTTPSASEAIVNHALAHGKKVLVGTSGWSAARIAALQERMLDPQATGEGAGGVIIVPNFSVGSVLGTALAQVAAQFFDSIEIVETHGPAKVDSPSGTAIRTAELVAKVRDDEILAPHVDQPARGQQIAGIPVHSRRMAGIVAQQEVLFGGTGETLTVRHDTSSSASYEKGILLGLRAARTATGVSVGLDGLLAVADALRRVADGAGADSTETVGSGARYGAPGDR